MSDAPRPSGTVVVVRDGASGLELLLLERNTRSGKPGPWVFPGGRVEAADRVDEAAGFLGSARRAAVREASEEAGLALDETRLVPISRWITPNLTPKRFDTWFFLSAVATDDPVRVDGEEIRSHRWLAPDAAIEAYRHGAIRLAPPTFVTVSWLVGSGTTGEALGAIPRDPLITFRPVICPLPEGACILYPGDAGYDARDIEAAGPRHRLWSEAAGWRYERRDLKVA